MYQAGAHRRGSSQTSAVSSYSRHSKQPSSGSYTAAVTGATVAQPPAPPPRRYSVQRPTSAVNSDGAASPGSDGSPARQRDAGLDERQDITGASCECFVMRCIALRTPAYVQHLACAPAVAKKRALSANAFAQEWRGGASAAGTGTMHNRTKSTVRRHKNKNATTVASVDTAAAELGAVATKVNSAQMPSHFLGETPGSQVWARLTFAGLDVERLYHRDQSIIAATAVTALLVLSGTAGIIAATTVDMLLLMSLRLLPVVVLPTSLLPLLLLPVSSSMSLVLTPHTDQAVHADGLRSDLFKSSDSQKALLSSKARRAIVIEMY
eukprot:18135-Heterococcus_DN1.PRE.3